MASGASQSRALETPLTLTIVTAITLIPVGPVWLVPVLSLLVACAAAVAWKWRCRVAAATGLFCIVCLSTALAGSTYSQLTLGAGLLVHVLTTRRVTWLRGAGHWLMRGGLGADVWRLVLGSVMIAAGTLVGWYALFRPNVDDIVAGYVPALSLGWLLVGGWLFSMLNAAVEEAAYRGIIQSALESTLGVGVPALVLQAAAFGALHIGGFPRGWLGVGLAFIYGLMMGAIRRRAGGLLAPWIGHVATDVVIVSIILAFER